MNKKELKAKYGDEKVFVVPFDKLDFIKDGFTPLKHDLKLWSKFDNMGTFAYRYDVEGEPSMQQIIPYILITNKSENKIFATKRIAGDSRLLNKLSIACGGHIDASDAGKEVLFKAAARELLEEVNVIPASPFNIIGYVRDLNSSTNDHTGVVILLSAEDDIAVNEPDVLEGQWLELQDLIDNYENLENWSKYIVDYFVTNKKIG